MPSQPAWFHRLGLFWGADRVSGLVYAIECKSLRLNRLLFDCHRWRYDT